MRTCTVSAAGRTCQSRPTALQARELYVAPLAPAGTNPKCPGKSTNCHKDAELHQTGNAGMQEARAEVKRTVQRNARQRPMNSREVSLGLEQNKGEQPTAPCE